MSRDSLTSQDGLRAGPQRTSVWLVPCRARPLKTGPRAGLVVAPLSPRVTIEYVALTGAGPRSTAPTPSRVILGANGLTHSSMCHEPGIQQVDSWTRDD
jgi:hypothetical protein